MTPDINLLLAELRAETDFMECDICEDCNGVGSDENVPFYCSTCKGRGSLWHSFDPRVAALLDIAEAAQEAAILRTDEAFYGAMNHLEEALETLKSRGES